MNMAANGEHNFHRINLCGRTCDTLSMFCKLLLGCGYFWRSLGFFVFFFVRQLWAWQVLTPRMSTRLGLSLFSPLLTFHRLDATFYHTFKTKSRFQWRSFRAGMMWTYLWFIGWLSLLFFLKWSENRTFRRHTYARSLLSPRMGGGYPWEIDSSSFSMGFGHLGSALESGIWHS